MYHWEAFDISETTKRHPFISMLGKSNEKGGHNVATKCHNAVLWVIFTVILYRETEYLRRNHISVTKK